MEPELGKSLVWYRAHGNSEIYENIQRLTIPSRCLLNIPDKTKSRDTLNKY
jgi:hypothetical protein